MLLNLANHIVGVLPQVYLLFIEFSEDIDFWEKVHCEIVILCSYKHPKKIRKHNL